MWKLEYTQEANHYALDSYPYNEDVLVAIELLAQTESGLPESAYREWKPGHFIWSVAEHYVAFHRIIDAQPTIIILMIKPLR